MLGRPGMTVWLISAASHRHEMRTSLGMSFSFCAVGVGETSRVLRFHDKGPTVRTLRAEPTRAKTTAGEWMVLLEDS
jgi:hypothetical protein